MAWSACIARLSTSNTLPILLPISFPISSVIFSNGNPQIYTQKGEWEKLIFFDVKPFLQWQRRSRLLSKFHGPLFSTNSNWYLELNLNFRILFPTSTILKSEPIFHATFKVFFRALWFWWRFVSRHLNKLKEHSSKISELLIFAMTISSSSSFVSFNFSKLFITSWSMRTRKKKWATANIVNGVDQERTLREALKGGSKLLLCWERKKTPTGESYNTK